MKIVCIGDSLTFGYGIRPNENFVDLMKNQLSIEIINKGKNGDSTAGMLSRFHTDVLNHFPDICIILAGTNDVFLGRKISYILDNIIDMVNDCIKSNIVPIVVSPPKTFKALAEVHWYPDVDYTYINNELLNLSKNLHKSSLIEHFKFIDIFSLLPLEKDNFTDGVHLSSNAYKIISEELKKGIATVL